jgi:hypothetical protein
MNDNRTRLLFGPYRPPALKVGDRATCLYRDGDVIVTGWTAARIPWPRGRPVDVPKSHPSLLVDEELARAIRSESAAAIRYWWGVSVGVVWRWRMALGVSRTSNPGSARHIRAASEKGAAVLRGVKLRAEECERRRRTALELNLGRHLTPGYHGPRWTEGELALLGRVPDDEVAAQIGRTVEAVRIKRGRLRRRK